MRLDINKSINLNIGYAKAIGSGIIIVSHILAMIFVTKILSLSQIKMIVGVRFPTYLMKKQLPINILLTFPSILYKEQLIK